MAVLAIVTGSEPGDVVAHHVARLPVVFLGTPLVLRLLVRRAEAAVPGPSRRGILVKPTHFGLMLGRFQRNMLEEGRAAA